MTPDINLIIFKKRAHMEYQATDFLAPIKGLGIGSRRVFALIAISWSVY
jgi:hypothetical protein